MEKLGLYIHIPFCVRKCAYCDFYSMEQSDAKKDRYLDALGEYLDAYASQAALREVDTVYIGGGTPTCLEPQKLEKLIRTVKKKFNVPQSAEFTVEANPGTVSLADMKRLREAGMTRLSLGVQSVHDKELTGLTRIYNSARVFEALDDAKKAGFPEVSVDVMYGIPHQTVASLLETVDRLAEQPHVTHVSLYGLTLEEGTEFYRYRDILPLPDEDTEREMYFKAAARLEALGFEQYEISNFARPGHRCRHNVKYWNCDEYVGIGPGAHSYFAGKRFSYKRDIDLFTGEKAGDVIDDYMEIRQKDRIGEYVMLRLRMCDGIDMDVFLRRFGVDFEKLFFDRISPYVYKGYVVREPKRYYLSRDGMYISNRILSDVLDFGE